MKVSGEYNKVNIEAYKQQQLNSKTVKEETKSNEKGDVTLSVQDKIDISLLMEESEKAYDNLRKIVEDLLRRQGKSFKSLKNSDSIKVDDKARAEAAASISEDGELGVENTAERIFSFAKAISGGDKSKLDKLKEAIDQGFKEAEKQLGELPEISKQTYDRVMEKLDAWKNEE